MTLVYVGILILVIVLVIAAWTVLHPSDWTLKRVCGFYPGTLFRIATSERVVALTIDDAPHPDVTPGLLEELRAHGAKATFFVIGSYGEAHPHLLDSIRAEGHELANHLYTDRMSARLADAEFINELQRTDAIIQPLECPKWCRPGSGIFTSRIVRLMQQNGYTAVAGTAWPVDLYTNVRLTALHFLTNVRPGAILVLHDGGPKRANSVRVLSLLLPRLRDMGYRIVTLGELSSLGTTSEIAT